MHLIDFFIPGLIKVQVLKHMDLKFFQNFSTFSHAALSFNIVCRAQNSMQCITFQIGFCCPKYSFLGSLFVSFGLMASLKIWQIGKRLVAIFSGPRYEKISHTPYLNRT